MMDAIGEDDSANQRQLSKGSDAESAGEKSAGQMGQAVEGTVRLEDLEGTTTADAQTHSPSEQQDAPTDLDVLMPPETQRELYPTP